MIYHMLAFMLGFILDLILGDPYCIPHPICAIGNFIGRLEKHFLNKENLTDEKKRKYGLYTVILVCGVTVLVVAFLLTGAYWIHPILGLLIEMIMTYQILATKCLKVESMKVYDKLKNGTLKEARVAVSMIVGRDTKNLDEKQVARAAVETVAENTSDGVIAPMIYLAIGGPVLGFFYKAVNTMDSMIGYKNDRFLQFGRYAARLDDVVNYVPARLSAIFMIFSCHFLGKDFDGKEAKRIFHRDRYNHASPNSAQTESVCAGALGLRLAGDTSYFGKMVKKPFIGDAKREIEAEDILRANALLYGTAIISEFLWVSVMMVVWLLFCV